jgi:RNA polymerase sigma factor (TIGR02999 family)
MSDANPEVTALLRMWSDGDAHALDRLMPLVYDELRRRAAAAMLRERTGHTLEPTALVHEAYLRLVDQRRVEWHSRAQFYAVAAEMMRRVLVDVARARRAAKRSGRWARVTLDDAVAVTQPVDIDVLELDAALQRLAALDERKSRIAVLRFFAGLTLADTATALGVSPATVGREWRVARAWLFDALSGERSRHEA